MSIRDQNLTEITNILKAYGFSQRVGCIKVSLLYQKTLSPVAFTNYLRCRCFGRDYNWYFFFVGWKYSWLPYPLEEEFCMNFEIMGLLILI